MMNPPTEINLKMKNPPKWPTPNLSVTEQTSREIRPIDRKRYFMSMNLEQEAKEYIESKFKNLNDSIISYLDGEYSKLQGLDFKAILKSIKQQYINPGELTDNIGIQMVLKSRLLEIGDLDAYNQV